MSIFRETFTPEVKGQLRARQNAAQRKKPTDIIYQNSRNSWVRMTSSVNVKGKSDLAESYVLQGGILNDRLDYSLRSGVGTSDKAYSNTSPSGNSYNISARAGTAGLKPMPGIKSVDIKSKTAYGSLREVTVNFVANNQQQLEDLELLYMRPGYTVLIEWGWAPYLNNKGEISNEIPFYDKVLKGGVSRDQVFSDLFTLSRTHFGNYDAMFGYVKNYSWTARMDGGYDCTTTVISIGEILESLKVGWLSPNMSDIIAKGGLLKPISPLSVSPNGAFLIDFLSKAYAQNTLAGLCYELYNVCSSQQPKTPIFPKLSTLNTNNVFLENGVIGIGFTPEITTSSQYDLFAFPYMTSPIDNSLVSSGIQAYITLDSFVKILNKYILLYAGNDLTSTKPFIEISVKPNAYYTGSLPADEQDSLLCLAHPLQVSVDPTVCLITNPLWAKGFDTSELDDGANNVPTFFDNAALNVYDTINKTSVLGSVDISNQKNIIKNYIISRVSNTSDAKEFVRAFTKHVIDVEHLYPQYIFEILNKISDGAQQLVTEGTLSQGIYDVLFTINTTTTVIAEDAAKKAIADKISKGENPFGIDYLNDLQKGGKQFDFKDELGKIGNIYLNLDMLYRLAVDPSLYDKNELKLYHYLKKVLYEVQISIGSVNNFDIHVDPIDNVARIIDLNYIDTTARDAINDPSKDKIFQIEMSNTSGSVRSYNLQSQIFPEQGNMIAIGAQVSSANNQATSANTLLDFNNNLEDRIIPKKINPPASTSPTTGSLVTNLVDSFNKIKQFLIPDTTKIKQANGTETIVYPSTSEYKTSLKDIISYFQTNFYSNTKNRAIIPVKISLTMDGIGGLIIGHLFKLPPDLLPKGYKSDTVGGKLVQIVVGLGHKIENGDWTTTIDAYNIVTNNPTGPKQNFKDFIVIDPKTGQQLITATPNAIAGSSKDNTDVAVKFFLNQGYSKEFVAALVGSFLQESSMNPKSINFNSSLPYNNSEQTYAAGIAQWVGPRRVNILQYAKSSGVNVPRYEDAIKIVNNATKTTDSLNVLQASFNNIPLQTQLSFVNQELSTYSGFSSIKNTTDIEAANKWVYEKYEGGNYSAGAAFGGRGGYAQTIFQNIKSGKYAQAPLNSNVNTFTQ
jgi:hypothetical protein